MDYIESRMQERVKPDFGADSKKYFQGLIAAEIHQLTALVNNL